MSIDDLALRPCPFCNSTVSFDHADYCPHIECPSCDFLHDETPEQEAARWNRRPEVGAMRMILADLVGSAARAEEWLRGELEAEHVHGGPFCETLVEMSRRLKFDLDSARAALRDTDPAVLCPECKDTRGE